MEGSRNLNIIKLISMETLLVMLCPNWERINRKNEQGDLWHRSLFFVNFFRGYKCFSWGHWYPVLDSWWRMPWISKPGWITCVLPNLHAMDSSDSPLVWHLPNSWRRVPYMHVADVNKVEVLTDRLWTHYDEITGFQQPVIESKLPGLTLIPTRMWTKQETMKLLSMSLTIYCGWLTYMKQSGRNLE